MDSASINKLFVFAIVALFSEVCYSESDCLADHERFLASRPIGAALSGSSGDVELWAAKSNIPQKHSDYV